MPLTDDDNDPVPELPALPGASGVGSPPAGAPTTTAPSAPACSPDLDIPSRPSAVTSEPVVDGSGGLPSLPGFGFDTPPKAAPAASPGTGPSIKAPLKVPTSKTAKPSSVHDQSTPAGSAIAADADPYLGRNFGGYQLTARIGAGGMGVVYKGRQVSLDREVAVKILNKALVDNEEFIIRFEREAKSIARISHPNIVAVYDFGQDAGLYYMVTEFVEGSNLARMIGEKLMLSLEEMLPLVVNCLAGLHHVSASGIIHRDIKPDNILVTPDKVAKIADFGLAKNVADDKTDLTAVGLAMGTPAYMSPEQCMGRRLDVRSDVYALGVTAYFALTGEKPFVGQSSFEIMTKQREFTPPPPVQLNPRIAKEASALVMKMLAKNPIDRFRDAEDCRQAWWDLGVRLGILQSPMRSGEYKFDAGKPSSRPTGDLPAMPPASVSSTGVMPPITVPQQPPFPSGAAAPPASLAMLPVPGEAPSASSAGDRRRDAAPAPAAPAPADRREPGSEAHRVANANGRASTTERRASRPSGSSEATTCAKCGMLNRGGIDACQRCGAALREVAFDAHDQELQADRLLAERNFVEAAKIFGRLADKASDRKLRSVWRSKEREAKARAQEHQIVEIDQKSRSLVDSGDLRGGLDLLERGLKQVRDAGASSVQAESQLLASVDALRKRLSSRRRSRLIAVLVVAALVAGGAFAAWRGYLPGLTAQAGAPR